MNIDVRHILQLSTIPGIGPGRIKNLVNYFKETELIFKASLSELMKVEGIDKGLAKKIVEMRNQNSKFADEQLLRAEKFKAKIITLWDSEYPELLRKIYDPPVVQFHQQLRRQGYERGHHPCQEFALLNSPPGEQ